MRILLPTIELPSSRGGVGRYIDAIAKTIPEVEVVEWSGKIESHGFDAVWVHHILPIGTQAWLQRKPYVIFLHGMDFDLARRNAWKRFLTKCILRGAAHVVTNSKALAKEVATFANIAEPLVVYPCVSDELRAASDELRARHHADTLRLLTVGRLVERKGHLHVLEAIKDIANIEYTIIGDGPMRAAILAKIQEYGISSRVRLMPDVSDADVADAYRDADVFVMPSTKSETDREGFGIVYIEAALFCVPSVAVRQPGVDEAITDGETGWLIEDSVGALRDVLGRLSADRTLRVPRGQVAQTRVLAEFTREAQFGKLRAII